MAGILDSKQRIMDTLVCSPGRAQAASGHMQLRYVTFTDRHAFYDNEYYPTASNIANDAGDRIYFEAVQRFQDLICLETDGNGLVKFDVPFVAADSLFEGLEEMKQVFTVSGTFPTGSTINDLVGGLPEEITEGVVNHFKEQRLIASKDPFLGHTGFLVNTGSIDFMMNENIPAQLPVPFVKDVASCEPVWNDSRFCSIPNFLFLPPVNKLPAGAEMERILPFIVSNIDLPNVNFTSAKNKIKAALLGDDVWWTISTKTPGTMTAFPEWMGSLGGKEPGAASDVMTQAEVDSILAVYAGKANTDLIAKIAWIFNTLDETDFAAARLAYMGKYPEKLTTKYRSRVYTLHNLVNRFKKKYPDPYGIAAHTITFPMTSRHNNLLIQIFEFPEDMGEIKKLAIVDGGQIADGNIYGQDQRVFYVGKVYAGEKPYEKHKDSDDITLRFANIFTIIMHDEDFETPAAVKKLPSAPTTKIGGVVWGG